jgi:hypothetical protein
MIRPGIDRIVQLIAFRAGDVDSAHERLADVGMETARGPYRRDDTRMYTSFPRRAGRR